jgi:hypothetical protein
MSPESIQVGKCYLTDDNTVRRVVTIHPDGRIQYEWRAGLRKKWKVGILSRREFTAAAEREVPCDWTPETDEASA